MKNIQPLNWDNEGLILLDQRVLPQKEEYIHCFSLEDVKKAIQNMVVRGAPAIGVAAAFAMVLVARQIMQELSGDNEQTSARDAFLNSLEKKGAELINVRPTAVNLSWGVEQMLNCARSNAGMSLAYLLTQLETTAQNIYSEDISVNKKIGAYGASLLPSNCSILTHCNAGALATAGYGTALGVIRSAFAAGKKIKVFADETRPFLQGSRLTAWELQQENIPVTLIVDSAAGYLMSKGDIDCVIVGADRIAANGDVANKIGTYTLAVLAAQHDLPFYVAAPRSTFDLSLASGKQIEVENRDAGEITHFWDTAIAPPGVDALNPSFDITPGKYITAIITEMGIITEPNEQRISSVCSNSKREVKY